MRPRPLVLASGLAACGLVAASCASVGPFVWVDDYAAASQDADPGYRIAPGDLLSVVVYNQPGMSARERVRYDGKVSLPLLRDVPAAGLTPNALGEQIEARLKEFLSQPVVTVAVEEASRNSIPVVGEVARPGQYALEPGAGVLEALAAAGGFNDVARRDAIFVLRRQPSLVRIRFTFEALSRGQGRATHFRLQAGDSVVVE